MRVLSIVCLLAVFGVPAAAWAQAGGAPAPRPTQPAAAGSPAAGAGATGAPASAPAKPAAPSPDATAVPPAVPAAGPTAPTPGPDADAQAVPGGTEPTEPEVTSEGAAASGGGITGPGAHEAVPAVGTSSAATIPSPGELGDRLVGDLPPQLEQKSGWTAPLPVLTLHGYLRVRAELMDSFWLGRAPNVLVAKSDVQNVRSPDSLGPDPFSRFRPFERSQAIASCANESRTSDQVGESGNFVGTCKVDSLQFASLRFRFSPQLNISEDIRIKSTFDVFDNYVLGQAPLSYYGMGSKAAEAMPGGTSPNGSFIVPRRAWAEVRNRDLGELRFGIMPEHWGLGMLYNAGNGFDDDFSTDFGRIMGTTKLAGFYISGAYDFMSEGMLNTTGKFNTANEYRPTYDGSQLDDLDQFTLSVVRRMPDEDEDSVLARGDALLSGGAHFQLRHQDSVLMNDNLRSLNGTFYTPDVWAQLRYGKLRLEVEAAWVLGKMRSLVNDRHQRVSELGAALESELRLLDDKLGLYIYTGAATGDSDVEGLSSDANFIDASGSANNSSINNSLVSTFRFHPSYRVDMILWRNIMRQITGAWYVKPGISYDFLRDNFGQLFGARFDLIYSRAVRSVQTWGNDPNLGVELNAQIYWRSDDGPGVDDGYHAALQYGVLFPLRGLGYYYKDVKLETAQTLRLLLGVVF